MKETDLKRCKRGTWLLLASLALLQACSETCNGHLKYGQPGEVDQMVCREGYALGYDYHYRNPAWVVSHLTAQTIVHTEGTHKVSHDRDIERGLRLEYRDYRDSEFVPGRLHTSNGGPNKEDYKETFILSNSAPQYGAFQRQLWPRVANYEKRLVEQQGEAYVTTGPIYAGVNRTLGRTQLGIPSHFYKVYYLPGTGRMSALLIPNTAEPGKRPLASYATSVENIEAYTGLDFYNKLLDVDEDRMKDADTFVRPADAQLSK